MEILYNTENKKVVQKYMEGFKESNHEKILSCLTDDIVWVMPGIFHLTGKEAFDNEIENPQFEGKPEIIITRLTEEDNIVAAEGTVKAKARNGGTLNALFCDVFHMENGKVKLLTTYQMNLTNPFS